MLARPSRCTGAPRPALVPEGVSCSSPALPHSHSARTAPGLGPWSPRSCRPAAGARAGRGRAPPVRAARWQARGDRAGRAAAAHRYRAPAAVRGCHVDLGLAGGTGRLLLLRRKARDRPALAPRAGCFAAAGVRAGRGAAVLLRRATGRALRDRPRGECASARQRPRGRRAPWCRAPWSRAPPTALRVVQGGCSSSSPKKPGTAPPGSRTGGPPAADPADGALGRGGRPRARAWAGRAAAGRRGRRRGAGGGPGRAEGARAGGAKKPGQRRARPLEGPKGGCSSSAPTYLVVFAFWGAPEVPVLDHLSGPPGGKPRPQDPATRVTGPTIFATPDGVGTGALLHLSAELHRENPVRVNRGSLVLRAESL